MPDTDGDRVLDGADNCPLAANADQANNDDDTSGDTCDSDDDNDTLADSEESRYGQDGWVTDPMDRDLDGDGVIDGADNCPLAANGTQVDTDLDGDGDSCDCQAGLDASVPNPEDYHHCATDRPDLRFEDRNCDGLDGMHDGDTETIGLYLAAVASNGDGSKAAPFNSLADAVTVASAQNRDLYIAQGEYDTGGLSLDLPGSIRLYGGFSSDFSTRTLDLFTPVTVLYTTSDDVVLAFEDMDDGVIQGLTLDSRNSSADTLSLLEITNGNGWQVEGTVLSVDSALSPNTVTAITLSQSEDTLLSGNRLAAVPAQDESIGILLDESNATIRNTLIESSESDATTGLWLSESAATLFHTTIDAGDHSQGSAVGIRVDDSTLAATNLLLLASEAQRTAGILCGSSSEITLTTTLFSYDTSLPLSLYTDCSGTAYTTVSDLESDSDLTAAGTLARTGTRSGVVDVTYHLVSGSPAINAGTSLGEAMNESEAGIAIDLDLNDRTDSNPDIGADEF